MDGIQKQSTFVIYKEDFHASVRAEARQTEESHLRLTFLPYFFIFHAEATRMILDGSIQNLSTIISADSDEKNILEIFFKVGSLGLAF